MNDFKDPRARKVGEVRVSLRNHRINWEPPENQYQVRRLLLCHKCKHGLFLEADLSIFRGYCDLALFLPSKPNPYHPHKIKPH